MDADHVNMVNERGAVDIRTYAAKDDSLAAAPHFACDRAKAWTLSRFVAEPGPPAGTGNSTAVKQSPWRSISSVVPAPPSRAPALA